MADTPFKWTCVTCDKEISQHYEYCPECEEKRYRKIGGLLYLPLLNILLIAYGYFTSLQLTLKVGLDTIGHLQISQSSYLFIGAGVNFIFLLYIIYMASLFVRRKRELPLAYTLLLAGGITHTLYACIWIPYFRYSVRVKKTFIR